GAWLALATGLEQAFLEDLVDGADGPEPRVRGRIDLAADAVRSLLGLDGPKVVHVSACAAGGLAVAHAAALVRRGAADGVLCGGVDSMVNPLGMGGMARLCAPSPRTGADACRPVHLRPCALALGEGASRLRRACVGAT